MNSMERAIPSDAELLAASRRGERDAFGHLVERYQNLVCAVSFSAVGDRALSEDVAQDTFLAAWRQLGELREPGKLRSWLCAIARNLSRKAARRRGREVPVDEQSIEARGESAATSPLDDALAAESERIVWESLRRVPVTYREALVLYYREGKSLREVAASLGIGEDAAAQRLSRGRKQLESRVASVVETALTASRPKKGFAAVVVASLPAAGSAAPFRAEHAPPHGHGAIMKFVIATACAVAAGAAIYVGTTRTSASPTEEQTTAAPIAAVDHAAPVEHAQAVPQLQVRPDQPELPPAPEPTLADLLPIPTDGPQPGTPVDPALYATLKPDPARSRGPVDAPVIIYDYTDFGCVHCGKVLGTIDQLMDEHPGKIRLAVKTFPVTKFGPLAAEAGLAAADQGKFWELHDLMIANQDDLTLEALLAYAKQAGLDVPRLRDALDSHQFRDQVNAEEKEGEKLGINGTPTFLINGRIVSGGLPIKYFRAVLNEALQN